MSVAEMNSMGAFSELKQVARRIAEDFESHGRDWARPGFQALLIYRLGVWHMSLPSGPLRVPFTLAYRTLFTLCRNLYGIELPHTVELGRRVVIEHQHGIVVHGFSKIGDGTVIRQNVTVGNRHPNRPLEAPRLGRDVNVGAGAKILGDVRVGDGATIGANAVVVRDVPAGDTVVGVPARSIHTEASGSKAPPLRSVPGDESAAAS